MATIDKSSAYLGVRQYHINMTEGDVGEYIILPGDPFRTDIIASYLDDPVMVMHRREHRTWTGTYKGIRVSVTSTGMGCPSTAIAVEELANIGGKVMVRLGTCAAFKDEIHPGDICITTGVYKQDGTSRSYVPESFPAVPDLDLTYLMIRTGEELCRDKRSLWNGITCSDDAFYAEDPEWIRKCRDLGCMNVDMESSALYTIAHKRGLKAATVCAVAANLYTGEDSIGVEDTVTPEAIKTATEIILEGFCRYDQERKQGKLINRLL